MSPARDRTVRIFDLDGSVTSQSKLLSRLADRLDVVDLRELAPLVRCLPSKQALRRLENAVAAAEPRWLTFTGSGDFHHVTTSILRRFTEPISVIVFDNHSDWIRWSIFPCGAWLADAVRMLHIAKLVSIGTGSLSISGWKISHGPLRDLFSGRVELYPYECRKSRCLGRRRGNIACAEVKRRLVWSDIYWRMLTDNDWHTLLRSIVDGLPTSKVYLSIDKDCLSAEYSVSNWNSGALSLDQLVQAIRIIADSTDLVGADITGEYSEVRCENRMIESLGARFRPKLPPVEPNSLERNEATNLALVDAMGLL